MEWNEKEKKGLWIFGGTVFGLTALMGVLMGYSYNQGNDVKLFPNAQMYYPAAGVILALLFTREKEEILPIRYFIGFLLSAAMMIFMAIGSVISPEVVLSWQYAVYVAGIGCFILLLTEKKAVKSTCGLNFSGKKGARPWRYFLLFLALYFLRCFVMYAVEGKVKAFLEVLAHPAVYVQMILLCFSFFLTFTAFFGEEYGWRWFFQPLLQKRFGLRGGVVILGVIWGIWHLPLSLFYHNNPSMWAVSLLMTVVNCVCTAIFYGYVYMETENAWLPVIMHFVNNSLSGIYAGTADENAIISVLAVMAANLVFGVFIFAKTYRKDNFDLRANKKSG